MTPDLLTLSPVPALLGRVRAELAAAFDASGSLRVSRAPGRLDVMGGIADYTGSLVAEATIDAAAAVVTQARGDRELQVFSFNLFDEHKPFTFRMPLEALAKSAVQDLRREFGESGRQWAAYLAGCLFILHDRSYIDLLDPSIRGLNLALLSTVPIGAGLSSSAAIEVATMLNLVDHFGLREAGAARRIESGLVVAELCQQVENQVVGAPCGIMDQVASCLGESGTLLQMICQPHELQPSLRLPERVRVVGINSNVKHQVGGGAYGRTRCAAFMGHRIILELMRELGASAGRELIADPMRGYLANLVVDDYKQLFRPRVPETMRGQAFLDRYGSTIDAATRVDPAVDYAIRRATDHHVLEANRVRRFAAFLEQASQDSNPQRRGGALDRAGHLMYASHQSYTLDALLGAPECDRLVGLAREREKAGIYGAKITGGGSGGTVAVLADRSEASEAALGELMVAYQAATGLKPMLFTGSSPGAWHVGTALVLAHE